MENPITHTSEEFEQLKQTIKSLNDTVQQHKKNSDTHKHNSETHRRNYESLKQQHESTKQANHKLEMEVQKLRTELEKIMHHIHTPDPPTLTPKTGAIPKQPPQALQLNQDLNQATQNTYHSPSLITEPITYTSRPISEDKLPHFIENVIAQSPTLNTYDPNSIMQWLEYIYNIHIRYNEYFPLIVKRILTCSPSSYLQRLMDIYNPKISYLEISNKVLQDLTTNEIRMQYNLHYIFRKQRPQEPFREFAEDILKYGFILATYSNSELINCILSHSNEVTRNKFLFQKQPITLNDLKELICKVEKLELSDRQTSYPLKYHSQSREDLSHLLQDMNDTNLNKQVTFQNIQDNTQSFRPTHDKKYRPDQQNYNQQRYNRYENNRNNYNRYNNPNNYRGSNYKGNNYNPNYNRQYNTNRGNNHNNNYNGYQNQIRHPNTNNYNNGRNNNNYRPNNNTGGRQISNTQYKGSDSRNYNQNKSNGHTRPQFNYMKGNYNPRSYNQYMPYPMPFMNYYPHNYPPFPYPPPNPTNMPPPINQNNAPDVNSNNTNNPPKKTYTKQKTTSQNAQSKN